MKRAIAAALLAVTVLSPAAGQYRQKTLVAHRGASAYAPEHTLDAYRLAVEQGADYVEQDLQITRDGVLICMHDTTLERTTNVKEVFPDRTRWDVSDFTLAEIKQLDAGSWFDPKFKGVGVPTFQEAIDLLRGRTGLYPETKEPEFYESRGFNMAQLVADILRRNGLDMPVVENRTPVIIQSFSAASLERFAALKIRVPLVLLVEPRNANVLSEEGLRRLAAFAQGIGPAKEILENNPSIVRWAHAAGLSVTPYTFRSSATGKYPNVRQEMAHFLNGLGVDALFTDNPDQFPR